MDNSISSDAADSDADNGNTHGAGVDGALTPDNGDEAAGPGSGNPEHGDKDDDKDDEDDEDDEDEAPDEAPDKAAGPGTGNPDEDERVAEEQHVAEEHGRAPCHWSKDTAAASASSSSSASSAASAQAKVEQQEDEETAQQAANKREAEGGDGEDMDAFTGRMKLRWDWSGRYYGHSSGKRNQTYAYLLEKKTEEWEESTLAQKKKIKDFAEKRNTLVNQAVPGDYGITDPIQVEFDEALAAPVRVAKRRKKKAAAKTKAAAKRKAAEDDGKDDDNEDDDNDDEEEEAEAKPAKGKNAEAAEDDGKLDADDNSDDADDSGDDADGEDVAYPLNCPNLSSKEPEYQAIRDEAEARLRILFDNKLSWEAMQSLLLRLETKDEGQLCSKVESELTEEDRRQMFEILGKSEMPRDFQICADLLSTLHKCHMLINMKAEIFFDERHCAQECLKAIVFVHTKLDLLVRKINISGTTATEATANLEPLEDLLEAVGKLDLCNQVLTLVLGAEEQEEAHAKKVREYMKGIFYEKIDKIYGKGWGEVLFADPFVQDTLIPLVA
jgi:hypothetical protein